MPQALLAASLEGTENRMFSIRSGLVLAPEITNYIRAAGAMRLGGSKVFYVARCFRDETSTDATRLREFTQIGVELLSDNALDARSAVRKDALRLIRELLGQNFQLVDNAKRGLNLYNQDQKPFEFYSSDQRQLLGGGPYEGGAGWALGLERLMSAM